MILIEQVTPRRQINWACYGKMRRKSEIDEIETLEVIDNEDLMLQIIESEMNIKESIY